MRCVDEKRLPCCSHPTRPINQPTDINTLNQTTRKSPTKGAAPAAATAAAAAAALLAAPLPARADAAADAARSAKSGAALLARLLESTGDVSQPGAPAPWAPRQTYYPDWMFGEWEVASRYTAFRAPLGDRFVRPALLAAARAAPEDGGIGSSYSFRQRFYSTLPDTFSNNLRVNLGFLPEDAIISDRKFNVKSSSNAYLGVPGAVQSVNYDPSVAPDRLTLEFSRVGEDMRPLPPRRVELYIQNM